VNFHFSAPFAILGSIWFGGLGRGTRHQYRPALGAAAAFIFLPWCLRRGAMVRDISKILVINVVLAVSTCPIPPLARRAGVAVGLLPRVLAEPLPLEALWGCLSYRNLISLPLGFAFVTLGDCYFGDTADGPNRYVIRVWFSCYRQRISPPFNEAHKKMAEGMVIKAAYPDDRGTAPTPGRRADFAT